LIYAGGGGIVEASRDGSAEQDFAQERRRIIDSRRGPTEAAAFRD
jgi:hypothetical protein